MADVIERVYGHPWKVEPTKVVLEIPGERGWVKELPVQGATDLETLCSIHQEDAILLGKELNVVDRRIGRR